MLSLCLELAAILVGCLLSEEDAREVEGQANG